MGEIAVGTVVAIRFPFSDLTQSKLRPAVVLANAGRGDWILCQVTSRPYGDPAAITLQDSDFESGSLPLTSFVRPGKLFTANELLLVRTLGRLVPRAHARVANAVIQLIESNAP